MPKPARVPTKARTVAGVGASIWPLAVHSSKRYLVDAQGTPFFFLGDTAWSGPVNLTTAQMDTYLNNRQSRGFTAVLFNAIEHQFSNQSPAYQNVSGQNPFTTMTDFASPNEAYWQRVDYFYAGCLSRGMVPLMNPAYLGFNGGSEGWTTEVNAEVTADLQTYGAFLGARYPNAMFAFGGDYAGDATLRAKQWNIATGIRSVTALPIFTAHSGPDHYSSEYWDSATHPGFALNWGYCYEIDAVYPYQLLANAYAAAGPIPVAMIEMLYEGEHSTTAAQLRRQSYTSLLSGACGAFFGNQPVWSFSFGWDTSLDSTGAADQGRVASLFKAYQWWRLVPKTDTSFVSSALGSNASRVCAALASDGSFGMVWIPTSQSVTVVMSNFAQSSVRARLYDPAAGTFSTVSGSPFANTGSQTIASGGEAVLVLD